MNSVFQSVPPELRPASMQAESWLREAGDTVPEIVRARLPAVWTGSEFAAHWCRADAGRLAELAGDLTRRYAAGDLRARVTEACGEAADEMGLMTALRRVRNREMVRIAWRDLAGWAELAETLGDLSVLADASLDVALDKLNAWHAARHGTARSATGEAQRLVVLGMGKLGAGELNFSSDVDLIFAYPAAGESDGERPLDNEQYFTRLGQKLIRVMDQVTTDGFVFRVDMRLRPFGESGPLVMNFDAMETYYQNHGREWERYAFIKARPVAGDLAAGRKLLSVLRPFVYRRYLDYGVFESLRGMKEMISQEVERRDLQHNIKLGSGGIREIEFIGQAFQLIRGGREPQFQERAILRVLAQLGNAGYLGSSEVADLREAYIFLRRVENRLQMHADQQTHELPQSETDRARLAWSMGYEKWPVFDKQLRKHCQRVHAIFSQIIVEPRAQVRADGSERNWRAVWQGTLETEEALRALREAGYKPPEETLRVIEGLRASAEQRRLSERGRMRLNELVPAVLRAAAETEAPGLTLARLVLIIEAVLRRSAYIALLLENPRALSQLTRLCAASQWIADMLASHPVLLDELIDPRIFQHPPELDRYGRELEAQLRKVAADDLESLMDALREFQQVSVMRVTAADIGGVLPLMKVSDHLTAIAEQVVGKVLEIAWRHLVARHGMPRCEDEEGERPARFVIVAYGKLGGIELGYGSDLDLVFLHDSAGEGQRTDGEKPLDNSVFFLRLTQRIIHLLATPTSAGVLYEVDTRLRPSGSAGLLVSSLQAFARYQREQAWTWEHQALLRARPVAGDIELAARFEALRRELLCQPRDAAQLRADVLAMRERMRRELGRVKDADFDIKQDSGGLTDLEFLVQYWVLLHAHAHPDLVDYPDIIRFLDGLEIHGLAPVNETRALVDAYRTYRARIHEQSLKGAEPAAPAAEFAAERELVRRLWSATMEADG